jgi:hypothetical protein
MFIVFPILFRLSLSKQFGEIPTRYDFRGLARRDSTNMKSKRVRMEEKVDIWAKSLAIDELLVDEYRDALTTLYVSI